MDIFVTLLAQLIFLVTIVSADTGTRLELQGKILKQLFNNSKYDKRLRPARANSTSDGPVDVNVNMFVRGISRIDYISSEYDLQLSFREEWVDERLKYDSHDGKVPYVSTDQISEFWVPDVFFSNEQSARLHNILTPNAFLRIFPDGTVLYSIRISLTLYCGMNLRRFPFDTQSCPLRIATYGQTTDDIQLIWKTGDPIQVTKQLAIKSFRLKTFSTDYCTSKTNTGEYSCLSVELQLERLFFGHVFHIFGPLFLLVVASWISFWLNPTLVWPRLATTAAVVACALLQLQSNGHLFVSLPYLTALEIWVAAACLCIFGSFLESLYVTNIHKLQLEASSNAEEGTANAPGEGKGKTPTFKFLWAKSSGPTPKIDVISRVSFPLFFIVLNVIYWPLLV